VGLVPGLQSGIQAPFLLKRILFDAVEAKK
jgi:hypothetical protein